MALSIKDSNTEQLVRLMATLANESITEAIANAARERLEKLQGRRMQPKATVAELMKIAESFSKLPVFDARTPDEILDFDERGLPR